MKDMLLELKERCENGDFDDNELIDLVLHLDRENQMLLEENIKLVDENAMLRHYKKLYQGVKERNDKTIEYIKTNCLGIDSVTMDIQINQTKLLEILKGESNE